MSANLNHENYILIETSQTQLPKHGSVSVQLNVFYTIYNWHGSTATKGRHRIHIYPKK